LQSRIQLSHLAIWKKIKGLSENGFFIERSSEIGAETYGRMHVESGKMHEIELRLLRD
jgi:hypothetical protein